MKILLGIFLALAVLVVGYLGYLRFIGNANVMAELKSGDGGERARKVMIITLPDATELPVNYLREQDKVFVGVDGLWWREFREGPTPVTMLIRGERLTGQALAILDDPDYTADVFSRLRPTAPTWLPGRMKGVLVEIALDAQGEMP